MIIIDKIRFYLTGKASISYIFDYFKKHNIFYNIYCISCTKMELFVTFTCRAIGEIERKFEGVDLQECFHQLYELHTQLLQDDFFTLRKKEINDE